MAARFTAATVFKAVDQMSRPMRAMAKGAKSFANKADAAFARVERRVRKLKKSIGTLGFAIGTGLLISAVGSTIRVFADFEQANASLAAVMGKTVKENEALARDSLRLGAITAKTSTEVTGLQESFARLGFEQADIINMTEATIAGSVAMNSELADTADLVGAMVKSFDDFSSADAPTVIDQMTLATQKSALSFEKLQTGLPIVAGAANAAGVPFTRLLALFGKLSDAGIDASSSSTALRNIFIDSASQGLSYDKILEKIVKDSNKLTAANDEFGKRGAISAVVLAKQLKSTAALDKALQGASGTAQTAADKQLNTLNGRLTLLSSAWEGLILSVENGNGSFSKFLKTGVEVITEILAIASGTQALTDNMNDQQKMVRFLAERSIMFLKVLKWLIGAYVTFKIVMLAAKVAMIAYNVILGITTVLQGKSALALRGNAIALGAYKVAMVTAGIAMKAWTAAQWLLNIALNANPIGVIIMAIIALVAIVTAVIVKWDEWGAALTLFMGPLGIIIQLVQSFRESWELVKASFKGKGILGGLFTIGKVIFDAILFPLQQVLELLGNLGLDFATDTAAELQAFRDSMFESERALLPEGGETLDTPNTVTQQENIRREERIVNQRATLRLENNTDFDAELDAPTGFPLSITPTF